MNFSKSCQSSRLESIKRKCAKFYVCWPRNFLENVMSQIVSQSISQSVNGFCIHSIIHYGIIDFYNYRNKLSIGNNQRHGKAQDADNSSSWIGK